MLSIIKSIVLYGLEGRLIQVQVDISKGMPALEIVGLPDTSVRESKERVKIAIKNSGIDFPNKRITVNLAPADTRKEGSMFDLAIAIGILLAMEVVNCPDIETYMFIGELSLDGSIRNISGILPMCIEAKKLGIRNIFVPKENELEASIVNDINVLPVSHILEVLHHLSKCETIKPAKSSIEDLINTSPIGALDFADVKGQSLAKRGLEIAAAGRS